MTKILIVDDHFVVRRGLKEILAESMDEVKIDEASSGGEALQAVQKTDYDVTLLDLALPDQNGLEVMKQLLQHKPGVRVLILSMYPEDQYATRALRAGAAGYLSKASVPDELAGAVRKVIQGGKYISASLAERLAGELGSDAERAPHEALSDREFQVLRRLGAGKTPTEISVELHLSIKTISTYRSRILDKLHLSTTAQIIHYAVEHGLVEL
jgi:two-component system invasion response regulator UvrY